MTNDTQALQAKLQRQKLEIKRLHRLVKDYQNRINQLFPLLDEAAANFNKTPGEVEPLNWVIRWLDDYFKLRYPSN